MEWRLRVSQITWGAKFRNEDVEAFSTGEPEVPAWERSFSSICESAVFCIRENKSVFNHFLTQAVALEFLRDFTHFPKRWSLVKPISFVVLQGRIPSISQDTLASSRAGTEVHSTSPVLAGDD